LHPAGHPEKLRAEHFPRLHVPVLFVSGTRDSLAGADALRRHAKAIRGPVDFWWIESADHGFRPLKASGITTEVALRDAAAAVVAWVTALS
jgi:predicted alpha/beta-hydrolase family hydrolase